MNEWSQMTVESISTSILPGPFGTQLHNSDYTDSGVPVIMPRDMIDGRISDFQLVYVSEETAERLTKYRCGEGDILVARKGDVRKCVLISEKEAGWIGGSDCLIIRLDKEICFPLFVYYQLKSPKVGAWMQQLSIGATMPSLNTTLLGSIKLTFPNMHIQQRIAYSLLMYDSLIINNQKQITLLEEAVQRLYKEWFVDLRFPGYEKVKVVDGVPEGWKLTYLGEIACFHRGQVISQKNIHNGIIPVVAGGLEPAYYCDKSNTENRVITISGSGANAGYTRLYYERIWASDCSFIDSTRTNYLYFTYSFLKANKGTINNLQRGAAQPHVYAKDINDMELLLPEDKVLKSFENNVVPFFDLIAKLVQQIKILTEARDRLLPKLMSGEIEV